MELVTDNSGVAKTRVSRHSTRLPAARLYSELAQLLVPHSVETFFRESWEHAPCVIERNDPAHYTHLLSTHDIDALISLTRPHTDVLLVRSQGGVASSSSVKQDASGAANVYWLYSMYHEGYTIIVNGVDLRWNPIRKLCRGLESDIQHRVGANLYFTPRGAQGFLPHFDDHDVFILQLEGSKNWCLFESPSIDLPLREMESRIDQQKLGAKRDLTLRAGDLLYIPRGVVHQAVTSEESSVHLTVGIYVTRWMDVIVDAIRLAAARGCAIPESAAPWTVARRICNDDGSFKAASQNGSQQCGLRASSPRPDTAFFGSRRSHPGRTLSVPRPDSFDRTPNPSRTPRWNAE